MMTCHDVGCGHSGGLIHDQGLVPSVSLTVAMFGGGSMITMEKDGNWVNVKRERIVWTKTDDLEAIL